jgi:predicted dinucleotide-binding enzyme
VVGRSHAARLAALGHLVVMGTRHVAETLARTETDAMGNVPLSEWRKGHPRVALAALAEAAAHGELVFNALNGEAALPALQAIERELEGKALIDITNPLDFSQGMPPTLWVCNTDSLGERIQRALPNVRVVKMFNTVNAFLQVDPRQLAGGDHSLFVSGNDAAAKETAVDIARSYGWKHILDLGDITTARGPEMMMPVWLRLWGALRTPMFNYKIVQAE